MNQKSIAILPLHNTSADPDNQYFADGISEEIINALSKIQGLKVTARTSSFLYRESKLDIRQIGNELGVSTILEGSVRKSGDRVRIATQLIRTDTGFQLWSESFDRKLVDIFDLQDEISRLIAERIRENFGHLVIEEELVQAKTTTPEAYNEYLKGRYYQLQWTNESISKAQKAYKKSISIDADYPMPYLALIECFIFLASWNKSNRLKGLYMAHHLMEQLGTEHEHLPEYHYTRGLFHLYGKWEFNVAEGHFLRALQINPNYSEALEAKAIVYMATGNSDAAENAIEQALHLSPNSTNHFYAKAILLYSNQRFDDCLRTAEIALNIDPGFEKIRQIKALCHILTKEQDALQQLLTNADPSTKQAFLSLWHAHHSGQKTTMRIEDKDFFIPIRTYLHIAQNEMEEAIDALKSAALNQAGQYIHFAKDPFLVPLHKSETFKKLIAHYFGEELVPQTLQRSEAPAEMLSSDEAVYFTDVLNDTLEQEQLFLTQHLTLAEVGDKIDLHPNKLSWLINKKLGKGFNDYINAFRLEAFKKMALDPANKHLTLLGLAYESGFNSKSVFNEFFKKSTGMTPKAWVKAQS